MLAEFRAFPSALAIYMSAQMYAALVDLTSRGEPTPPDLYERFLVWTPASMPRADASCRGTARCHPKRWAD